MQTVEKMCSVWEKFDDCKSNYIEDAFFCMRLTALREKEVVLLYFGFLSTSEYEFHNVLILKNLFFISIWFVPKTFLFTLFPFSCSFNSEEFIFVSGGVYWIFFFIYIYINKSKLKILLCILVLLNFWNVCSVLFVFLIWNYLI